MHGEVHVFKIVAIPAFARIRILHHLPDTGCQLQALGLEFFARINAANEVMIELVCRLDLACDLMNPGLGNVAIEASCAHACSVAVVNSLLVFEVHICVHLVTANAERLAVGQFHGPVEAARPEFLASALSDGATQRLSDQIWKSYRSCRLHPWLCHGYFRPSISLDQHGEFLRPKNLPRRD